MLLLPSFFFRGRDSPTFEKTSPFEKILQNDWILLLVVFPPFCIPSLLILPDCEKETFACNDEIVIKKAWTEFVFFFLFFRENSLGKYQHARDPLPCKAGTQSRRKFTRGTSLQRGETQGGSCATKNMVSVNEHVGERYERREKNMIHLRRCGECGAGRRERVAK